MLIGAMRYILLRPALKRGLMRGLSVAPSLLLVAKRFGARAGLGDVMGHGHLAINGRSSNPALQGRLNARGARIYDDLRRAMSDKAR